MDAGTGRSARQRLAGQLPRFAAGLLLVAAILKLHALLTRPTSNQSLFLAPRAELCLAYLEFLLGTWLLTGLGRRAAWWAATAFFATVLAVAAYQGWTGQASCGCLGQVQVHPWTMVAVDAAVLTALLLSRRQWCRDEFPALAVGRIRWIGLTIVCFLGLALAAWMLTSQDTNLLARLRGEVVTLRPFLTDLGTAPAGTWQSFRIEVHNSGATPVRIVGGSIHCACRIANTVPLTVPPGGQLELNLMGRFPATPGRFQSEYVLYTDHPQHLILRRRFTGRVLADELPPAESANKPTP
ncbi:MAG: DUF1573 domain-containing protein [Gemmatales bacterium]|nr:DUF1573 domain-containing protein [Gemmatales bacterium]MDW8224174.1 hypothetical protein [Gemmatales bacterium]